MAVALTKCRECGGDVSTEAHACPHCGAPVPVPVPATTVPPPKPAVKRRGGTPANWKPTPLTRNPAWLVMYGTLAIAFGLLVFESCSKLKPKPTLDKILDYPLPGSPAAVYCDTNDTGPGIVLLPNGERYDKKCLNGYPWRRPPRFE